MDAPVTTKANGSRLDESGEANGSQLDDSKSGEEDDSNPFVSIVSEGESSGEEDEGAEGDNTEHPFTKQQETFIQEAMSRRTTHSQHCKYVDDTVCTAVTLQARENHHTIYPEFPHAYSIHSEGLQADFISIIHNIIFSLFPYMYMYI